MAQSGEPKPILRVRSSEDKVREATSLAFRMAQDGETRYECLLAVQPILDDRDVSEAIVDYALAATHPSDQSFPFDRSRFWTAVSAMLLLLYCLGYAVLGLYQIAVARSNEFFLLLFVVWLQWLCIRLGWQALRGTAFALTEHLNGHSFPTALHPAIEGSAGLSKERTRRLRGLLKEAVSRIQAGENPHLLYREYSRIELTPAAAWWLVAQARFQAAIGTTLPPYEKRPLAWIMQGGFFLGCVLGLYTLHLRGIENAPYEYLGAVAGVATAFLGRGPRRRLNPKQPSDTIE